MDYSHILYDLGLFHNATVG